MLSQQLEGKLYKISNWSSTKRFVVANRLAFSAREGLLMFNNTLLNTFYNWNYEGAVVKLRLEAPSTLLILRNNTIFQVDLFPYVDNYFANQTIEGIISLRSESHVQLINAACINTQTASFNVLPANLYCSALCGEKNVSP